MGVVRVVKNPENPRETVEIPFPAQVALGPNDKLIFVVPSANSQSHLTRSVTDLANALGCEFDIQIHPDVDRAYASEYKSAEQDAAEIFAKRRAEEFTRSVADQAEVPAVTEAPGARAAGEITESAPP
jgi:hypothetical protein